MSRLTATITGLALVPLLGGLAACSTTDTKGTTTAIQNPVRQAGAPTTTGSVVSVDAAGQPVTPPADAVTGVDSVLAGSSALYALKSDGTVVAWDAAGQRLSLPSTFTRLQSIDSTVGTNAYTLAVTADGRVVGQAGSETVAAYDGMLPHTGMKSVATGSSWAVGLTDHGTVVATGDAASVPDGLDGVTQVAAGPSSALALKNDGTVVWWSNEGVQKVPAEVTNVATVANAPSYWHAALRKDGLVLLWNDDDLHAKPVVDGATAMAMGYVDTMGGQPVLFVEAADGTVTARNPVAGTVATVPSMKGATALAAKGGAAVAIVPSP